ncbi:uncharacterized protein LOC111626573 isoform X1 [Centruroides sculpturatus]|uniref:uncharacterized protein LOC111626573 isoform X1 n=1 Tax=Centruroides sculpturatus TaxID=218467 RepID=UPI000C6E35FB|nr:uncharacterized protein LOC111626573 isoform X1 [Centruroides sculpturatus]
MNFQTILLVLCAWALRSHRSRAQCLRPGPLDLPNKTFPDVTRFPGGFRTVVRVNDYYSERSLLVTEFYHAENSAGRVEVEREGEKTSFVYFDRTHEVFTVRDFGCRTTPSDRFQFPAETDPSESWVYRGRSRLVLGPSAALVRASEDYRQGKVVYMGKSAESVRGIPAELWQECVEDGRINAEYYFAEDTWKNEFGESTPIALPLRAVFQGRNLSDSEVFQTHDFVLFRPGTPEPDRPAVPDGKGCLRLAQDLPIGRTFVGTDLSYSAEILYTPESGNYSYVSYVDFVYDGDSEYVAFRYGNWTRPFRDGKRRVDAYRRIVYDTRNGVTYEIDEDSRQCRVSRREEMEPTIDLPDGILLGIGNELFLDQMEKFQYLGRKRRRDVWVDVYELTQKLNENLVSISTRYFHRNELRKEETPVAISLVNLDSARKVSSGLTINFYQFLTEIDDKLSAFDVDSCYPRSRHRRWISFFFEVRGQEELMRDAEPYLPVVRRRVADMVRDATGLAWTRISRVLVDFEVSGLLADVSLLDRPDYLWDFSYDSEGFLADPEDSVGMVSKHLCAKFCLEYPGMCYAFSYCGKTCYLKTKSSWTKRDSPGCLIYRRKTGYEPLITTDSALQKLNLALESGDLKISFSVKDVAGNYRDVELSVSAFDSHARDPDARYTKIADFDSHYTEYKYGYKLKKGADHVRNLGSLPYLTCQKTCLADPYCQSLSSCAGMAECLTSTKHAVEVPDRELVKKNDCLVLTRNYMDSFVRHDGLTKATTAAKRLPIDKQELCAKACLRDDEVDCRSFDFCPYSEHPSDRCLLHAGRHPDPRNEKLALDPTGLCGHYSRNHVRDFRKLKNRIPVDPAHLAVTGVTAEGCARLCAEGVEFPCGSFHFCRAGGRGKARCGLRTENDVSPATVSNSSCDTYLPAESSPEGRKAGRRGERSYSSGLTAGLGVFFFVLGSGFAVVALLIFGKITGRKI